MVETWDSLAFLSTLNEQQRQAVLHFDGPLLVLAGAGCGKTKMLTHRISALVACAKARPFEILAVTFTNKAAREMKERVVGLLNHMPGYAASLGFPEMGTFHSVCLKILRREGSFTSLGSNFHIYDDSDQLALIKQVMTQLNIDPKVVVPKSIQYHINLYKGDAVYPDALEEKDFFSKKLKQIYAAYQVALVQNKSVDFSEILLKTYELLHQNLEIRQKYQRYFKHVHVDEYQDTNKAQYLLLTVLCSASFGGHQNLCVVGDEDQSIYSWRGANIENILSFEKDYPGCLVVPLEQNYRSTSLILKAATAVIQNNSQRMPKKLWSEHKGGAKIETEYCRDEEQEARWIVKKLKKFIDKGYRFEDCAIFYRTNAQSRPIEDVLRAERIPYQIFGGLKFYDRKEIKDIIAYLKVAVNPLDSIVLKRVINTPARGIGKTTLIKIEQMMEVHSITFWEALAYPNSAISNAVSKKLAAFVDFVARLQSKVDQLSLVELFHFIIDATGYVADLKEEKTIEAQSRIENLQELNTALEKYYDEIILREENITHRNVLLRFLEDATLAVDMVAPKQDADTVHAVQLMTLHSSKGLEFPVAFIAGCEEGLFPSKKSIDMCDTESDTLLQEERRLFYVGMTRAEKFLCISCARIRSVWGMYQLQQPSRFLKELPEDCCL